MTKRQTILTEKVKAVGNVTVLDVSTNMKVETTIRGQEAVALI